MADTKPIADTNMDPSLPGSRYSELPAVLRRFVDRKLKHNADIVNYDRYE